MSYLELLSLSREPFSNSPDPEAFYAAETHSLCLNRLEIAIRLKRGLNVVLGDVGTGKSTLCRKLVQTLSEKPGFTVFCLLDGGAESAASFLKILCTHFGVTWDGTDTAQAIEQIENRVLKLALEDKRQLVLLIDEGQKLTPEALEVLRVLLNFETNTEKLLQIIIFAQPEFRSVMDSMPNFRDRVNECLTLTALPEKEAVALLEHRLALSGGDAARKLFTPAAMKALYKAGNGRPRPMIRLAHQALLGMIMTNKKAVDAKLVKAQAQRNNENPATSHKSRAPRIAAITLVVAAALLGTALTLILNPQILPVAWQEKLATVYSTLQKNAAPVTKTPSDASLSQAAPAAATIENAFARTTADAALPAIELEIGQTSVAPAQTPTLGTAKLTKAITFSEAAVLFYGTTEAQEALQEANPGTALKRDEFVLPELAFRTPDYLLKNSQLSLAEFDSVQEALDALPALTTLQPRLAARRDPAGNLKFHLMARTSFSKPQNAWTWLAQKKPTAPVAPKILPPFGRTEYALYAFPER